MSIPHLFCCSRIYVRKTRSSDRRKQGARNVGVNAINELASDSITQTRSAPAFAAEIVRFFLHSFTFRLLPKCRHVPNLKY